MYTLIIVIIGCYSRPSTSLKIENYETRNLCEIAGSYVSMKFEKKDIDVHTVCVLQGNESGHKEDVNIGK